MNYSQYFSPTYTVARSRFRQSLESHGWSLESQAIDRLAPDGSELTIDIGIGGNARALQNGGFL